MNLTPELQLKNIKALICMHKLKKTQPTPSLLKSKHSKVN